MEHSCFTQRRQWHPTPVLLPGKSHGRRSLVGCSPWGCEESDMTEWLHFHFSLLCIGEGNGNPLQCSCLENPRDGVARSRTRLKWLSSCFTIPCWFPLYTESALCTLYPLLAFLPTDVTAESRSLCYTATSHYLPVLYVVSVLHICQSQSPNSSLASTPWCSIPLFSTSVSLFRLVGSPATSFAISPNQKQPTCPSAD